jgi:hypothetical protein
MIHKDYCSRCKKKNVPLMKHSKSKVAQYYYCRACNYDMHKKFQSTEKGKLSIRNSNRKHWEKEPNRRKARAKVMYAVMIGKLGKPSDCEVCGTTGRIEGHHLDYSKPLEVSWLCVSCHADYHRVLS